MKDEVFYDRYTATLNDLPNSLRDAWYARLSEIYVESMTKESLVAEYEIFMQLSKKYQHGNANTLLDL